MNRSNQGCWTCRIRHRKCDEKRPACRECSDRTIPCHGYGPKPQWMEDEWKLQAELSRIKKIVNQRVRQAKRKQRRPEQTRTSGSLTNNVPGEENGSLSQVGISEPSPDVTFREAQLLVHYLDYIFPLQYPYYEDQPSLGGRGWLFWLLMKRGPLHQAALTLSALHQHTHSPHVSERRESELIEYHTNALQRLRRVLRDSDMDRFAESREQMVEFLACGAALISFELFRGGLDNWQPHLHALASVVNKLLMPSVSGHAPESADGVDRAQPFLVTKALWLDILASTATGTGPQTEYQKWLELEQIDMSKVMGCQNWVMKAIGDISSIAARIPDNRFSNSHESQLRDIRRVLQEGIEAMRLAPGYRQSLIHAITCIFASAALIQIDMLGDGNTTGRITHALVSRVIAGMESLPSGVTYRGLVWPIATVGCVAAPDQQDFFRRAMRNVVDDSGSGFTNCGTVLEVLDHCWRYQRTSGGSLCTWQEGMKKMGICALLV